MPSVTFSASIVFVATVLVALNALAAEPGPTRAFMAELNRLESQAERFRPGRSSGPLRADNIRDEEVRELQTAARTLLPEAVVNIASVTAGCPCENGTACTAQVWIAAATPQKTQRLLFSRIDGAWRLGPAEEWWLKFDHLHASQRDNRNVMDLLNAEMRLLKGMPTCAPK